jgi:uncharacterized lipoprotein NlpE involved in copper resistance
MRLVPLLLTVALLTACAPVPEAGVPAAPADNSRTSLDWAGTYTGVLPSADREGIDVRLRLDEEGNYRRYSVYLGKDGAPIDEHGTFTWNAAGSTVTLMVDGTPGQQYLVGEGRLWQLDRNGERITGELADQYVLGKE